MPLKGYRTPQRTCVQCGCVAEKRSLLRIAGRPGVGWEPDPEGTRPGRGIYLCRKRECLAGFARRILTPKGAARWKMGTSGKELGEKLAAWRAKEAKVLGRVDGESQDP